MLKTQNPTENKGAEIRGQVKVKSAPRRNEKGANTGAGENLEYPLKESKVQNVELVKNISFCRFLILKFVEKRNRMLATICLYKILIKIK